jgi:hypothetical protein
MEVVHRQIMIQTCSKWESWFITEITVQDRQNSKTKTKTKTDKTTQIGQIGSFKSDCISGSGLIFSFEKLCINNASNKICTFKVKRLEIKMI